MISGSPIFSNYLQCPEQLAECQAGADQCKTDLTGVNAELREGIDDCSRNLSDSKTELTQCHDTLDYLTSACEELYKVVKK